MDKLRTDDRGKRRGFFQAIFYFLGYGQEPLPPAERLNVPVPTEKRVPEKTDHTLFLETAAAILLLCPVPENAVPTLLRGEKIWDDHRCPSSPDKDVKDAWDRISQHEVAAQASSWGYSSLFASLTELFCEALVRFQIQETAVFDNDRMPLCFGPLPYQSAVAVFNVVQMTQWLESGGRDSELSAHLASLDCWFRNVTNEEQVSSGDWVLLHLFYKGLSLFAHSMEQKQSKAKRELEKARVQARGAVEEQRECRFWQVSSRRKAREKVVRFLSQARKTEQYLSRSGSAAGKLDSFLKQWLQISPISGLSLDSPGNFGSALDVWKLRSIVCDCRSEGLQHWLVRRMVRKFSPAGAAFSQNRVFSCPLSMAEGDATEDVPSNADLCRSHIFLLRFYKLWTLSCPAMEQMAKLYPRPGAEGREFFRQFFEPWDRIETMQANLAKKSPFPVHTAEHKLLVARQQFFVSLEPEEIWNGRRLANVEEKFTALRLHLLNIRGVYVENISDNFENTREHANER